MARNLNLELSSPQLAAVGVAIVVMLVFVWVLEWRARERGRMMLKVVELEQAKEELKRFEQREAERREYWLRRDADMKMLKLLIQEGQAPAKPPVTQMANSIPESPPFNVQESEYRNERPIFKESVWTPSSIKTVKQ